MTIVKPGFARRQETVGHSTFAQVEKWDADQISWVRRQSGVMEPAGEVLRAWVAPAEVATDGTPNLTTTGGLGRLTSSLTGAGPVVFSATTTTLIGVGSSATAAAAADTNLGTPLYFQIADSTPTVSTTTVTNDTVTVVATFASANGNGAWNEWGLVLASSASSNATFASTGTSPILFNHKIASLGTKASGAAWAFTVKLTWS